MIEPNIAKLMSPADREYYQELGLIPDPAKQAKALARNEIREQRVFSAWMHQRRILYVNPRSDQKSTIYPGHPDFSIFLPDAKTLFIEMKAPGGRLSPEQIGRIEALRSIGHQVEIAWSAMEAIEIVRKSLEEKYGEHIAEEGAAAEDEQIARLRQRVDELEYQLARRTNFK